ncbi:hypothetical protein GCM10025868_13470 [Angustibacter aerolatus]|uniref:Uncharacterized protein n=1 Tax=Angustibacter aerolatus TaxID=1162965 RepID=A0ABQ6JD34_9ACTN|nr:hypothetical protein [Angustibacter aerolatus]GMA86097.1 hypothetical protein GCM10025868_13470 [Angustibacter aerolatus]
MPASLLGDVGHHEPGGVGRCRGADVGDEVEQRGVDLVADRADHRGAGRDDRPHEGLVAERQQVLERAAAAGDDDHVDVRVAVELLQRRCHLGHGVRSLDGDLSHGEADGRPPAAGVLDDVALGGAGPAADQADHLGQERQRALAVGGEQALGGQHPLEVLDAGEQARRRPPGGSRRPAG